MLPKINWKPTKKELRSFGLTLLIGFGVLSGLFYLKGSAAVAGKIALVAGPIGLLALVLPTLSLPFYWIWMGFAFVLGSIISRIIVFIIYFGIFTPIGLAMRLAGRDALKLKKSSFQDGTYWTKHPKISKENYERLF